MRGKIIQYNGADGSGTIIVEGKQYRFELAAWRGDKAPALNKTVEVELAGETVTAVTAVGDDVLMREKAAEMSNKLGAMWGKASASIQASRATNAGATDGTPAGATATAGAQAMPSVGGIPIVGLIRERYGVVIPMAWFLFLLGTLVFNAASMSFGPVGRSWSMFNLADMMSQAGSGGGFVKFLLIVGYLGIGVPMLWRNRLAWLMLLVPLIAVLWAVFDVLHFADQMGSGVQSAMGDMFHTGFGFWLALVMAIVLAGAAIVRFLKGS